ncbi:O-antigen ligase family protein [Halocola ammonii]
MIQQRISKITDWLIIAIFLFPVLPLQASGLVLILAFLSIVFLAVLKRDSFRKPSLLNPLTPLFLVALTYLVYSFWASDLQLAWFEFEKRAALLAVPVLIHLKGKINASVIRWSKLAFVVATSLLSFLLIILYVLGVIDETIQNPNFYFLLRTKFESISGVHPTYYGMFSGATLLILMDFQIHKSFPRLRTVIWVLLVVGAAGLILSGSRMSVIATLLVGSAFLLYFRKWTWFGSLLGGFALLAILSQQVFLARLSDLLHIIKDPSRALVYSGTGDRISMYQCSMAILKDCWLFGLGSDNVQTTLNGCYLLINPKMALTHNYNSHNEYLNAILTFGVWGLSLLIYFFVMVFRSIKSELLFSAIFGIVFFQMFTENILARQHGVFMVVMMTVLLVISRQNRSLQSRPE